MVSPWLGESGDFSEKVTSDLRPEDTGNQNQETTWGSVFQAERAQSRGPRASIACVSSSKASSAGFGALGRLLRVLYSTERS